jgi:hypothetical protein
MTNQKRVVKADVKRSKWNHGSINVKRIALFPNVFSNSRSNSFYFYKGGETSIKVLYSISFTLY